MLELLKDPASSLRQLIVLVDKKFIESKVQGKTEDQLQFWNARMGIGHGFHGMRKADINGHGEDSSMLTRVALAWNFEMVWEGNDIELPEC